jgi:hypothetical protein
MNRCRRLDYRSEDGFEDFWDVELQLILARVADCWLIAVNSGSVAVNSGSTAC